MKRFSFILSLAASLGILAGCEKKPVEVPEPDSMTLKGAVLQVNGEGGVVSTTLNTNVDFKVSIQEGVDWVKYNAPTKSNEPVDETLSFTVDKFEKSVEASRSAVVTISYTGLKSQVLTIVQTPLAQIYLKLTPDPDPARFTMDGGELSIAVQSSVDYITTISEGCDWITADPANPSQGDGTAKFTIEANKVKSDRDASITFTTEGLDPIKVDVHQDAFSSNIGIKSLSDFLEFVEASNVGDSAEHNLEKWVNEDGEICLLCDLDLGGITEWTPIGQSTDLTAIKYRSAVADSVRAFGAHFNSGKGVFNGMNHRISNLKITVGKDAPKVYSGFFGPIYNATVKNLIFDETCSLNIERANTDFVGGESYGFVTPSCIASTIENVTVKGSINVKKSYAGDTYYSFFVGGIAGMLCGNKTNDAIIKDCSFSGKVSIDQTSYATSNPKSFGAIAGYAVHDIGEGQADWADPENKHVTQIIGCTNSSDISGRIIYLGGIVGTDMYRVSIKNCVNNGHICLNSSEGNGRAGGIIGYDGFLAGQGGSRVENCENYGNVIATDKNNTNVGGIVGVISKEAKSVYTGNKVNCTVSRPDGRMGLFTGNNNSAEASFSSNKAKGYAAEGYENGEFKNKVEVNAENFSTYVGKNANNAPTFTSGIVFWK